MSLTEVHYITLREQGEDAARQTLSALHFLPIEWVHSDSVLCGQAARLKAASKMSFADSFVAATAQRVNATLVHKDPEFQSLASTVRQIVLPLK